MTAAAKWSLRHAEQARAESDRTFRSPLSRQSKHKSRVLPCAHAHAMQVSVDISAANLATGSARLSNLQAGQALANQVHQGVGISPAGTGHPQKLEADTDTVGVAVPSSIAAPSLGRSSDNQEQEERSKNQRGRVSMKSVEIMSGVPETDPAPPELGEVLEQPGIAKGDRFRGYQGAPLFPKAPSASSGGYGKSHIPVYCFGCGKESHAADASYCSNCGAQIRKTSPSDDLGSSLSRQSKHK